MAQENQVTSSFPLPAGKIRSKHGYGQQNSISVVPEPHMFYLLAFY
ncbi:MAG: hypothetical protein ABJB16_08875 [Saprospiraceae bacterium]